VSGTEGTRRPVGSHIRGASNVSSSMIRHERPAAPGAIPPFQAFLEENREIVYRFLVGAAGPVEADDLFQETFLAALRAYPKLTDGSSLRSWILTIATRKTIDAARATKRRPVAVGGTLDHEAGSMRSTEPPGEPVDGNGYRLDPDEPIWRAVLALPAKQRAAVVHRFVLDCSYEEVSTALGCSVEAARANVSEAVRTLRKRWNHVEAIR
jgi:RNA polymerase sigma factor (sigma-70 family)